MPLTDLMGANPVETSVQAVSAIATAAAAIFAALSARSASRSAAEMERTRELASAPVLTITPIIKEVGYHFDLLSGDHRQYPDMPQLSLENHGNGPALNLILQFEIGLFAAPLREEVLVGESTGSNAAKFFASDGKIRWEHARAKPPTVARAVKEEFIVSLAPTEEEKITIPLGLMFRWVIDAVSFNVSGTRDRDHVAHLTITVTFDTVSRQAERKSFRFIIRSDDMPALGISTSSIFKNPHYTAKLEPLAPRVSQPKSGR